jgi:hypothetical protein
MNRLVYPLISLIVIVVVIAMVMSQSLMVVQRLARATAVSGQVVVHRPGGSGFEPLPENALVAAGAVVQTGPQGAATLNWVDGTRLVVGPDTSMTVLRCQVNRDSSETSLFRLSAGKLLVRVRKILAGQSKFEISTPTATAGVRGTIFTVQVDAAGQTQVAVLEGKVNLEAGGQGLEVTPGYEAVAGSGSAQVRPLSAAARSSLTASPAALGPYVTLDQPRAGATVAPGRLEVSGQVEPGARLTLNGQAVIPGFRGRFRSAVQVPSGALTFTLRLLATDERNYQTEIARDLTVSAIASNAPAR